MQVQRLNNYKNNTSFGALYINPSKIEKAIGKFYGTAAHDAVPRLKELARDVNIRIYDRTPGLGNSIENYGFEIIISKIEPKIKNPIKKIFKFLFGSTRCIEGACIGLEKTSDETMADTLVSKVEKLKAKFIELGGNE